MQRELVQGPVPTAPPSFSTTPQISTTVAANSQHSQEIPTPLLEGPCPACSYHDQACLTPFYHTEIQILLVRQVSSLKYCSFPPCWSLPLAEGSSCCARPAGHLWALILAPLRPPEVWLPEHIFKSCSQLLSLAFCSLSCLCPRNSSLKLPRLSPAWCVWLLCPQGSPSTAFFCCTSSFSYH